MVISRLLFERVVAPAVKIRDRADPADIGCQ